MLTRLAASVSLALWTVFVPLALDLAHPVFSDCGDHADAGEFDAAAAARTTRDGVSFPDHASDSDCPIHGAPSRGGVPCCADGGCFCCGAVGLPSPGTRPLPVTARSARFAFAVDPAADGVNRPVFRPPRS